MLLPDLVFTIDISHQSQVIRRATACATLVVAELSTGKMDDSYNKDVCRLLVFPLVVIVLMYVMSSIVDSILGLNSQIFRTVFTVIEGIPLLIFYYNRELGMEPKH